MNSASSDLGDALMPSAASFFWISASMILESAWASILVPVAGTTSGAVMLEALVLAASFLAFLPACPSAGFTSAMEARATNAASAVTMQTGPERTHAQRRRDG